jgi:DNA-binding NarL/FixJ family response regulator
MSDPTTYSPAAGVRGVAPRRKRASRAERVFTSLRAGMALWEIARRENCSVRPVRRIVADALARLEIDPTAGYAQLQIPGSTMRCCRARPKPKLEKLSIASLLSP